MLPGLQGVMKGERPREREERGGRERGVRWERGDEVAISFRMTTKPCAIQWFIRK